MTDRSARCANCGASWPASLAARHCPGCGQETKLQPPTLREFVADFLGQFVALEGSLWRTLAALLLHPGRLTAEYLVGRRRRYVLPMRLYLSASFLFFLTIQVLGAGSPLKIELAAAIDPQGRPVRIMDAPDQVPEIAGLLACAAGERACSGLRQRAAQAALRAMRNVERDGGGIEQRVAGAMPYGVFLLMPVLAGLLAAVYRRRGLAYGVHVVFSLHLHAFWFLALLLTSLLPAVLQPLGWLLMPLYAVAALKRVHGGRWWPTVLRAGIAGVAYALLLAVVTLGIAFGAAVIG